LVILPTLLAGTGQVVQVFFHFHPVPVAAGFKPSNAGLLFDCSSNCTSTAHHVNQIIRNLQPAPTVAGFKPSNVWLLAACSLNCVTSLAILTKLIECTPRFGKGEIFFC
jgi:hypothetical protein